MMVVTTKQHHQHLHLSGGSMRKMYTQLVLHNLCFSFFGTANHIIADSPGYCTRDFYDGSSVVGDGPIFVLLCPYFRTFFVVQIVINCCSNKNFWSKSNNLTTFWNRSSYPKCSRKKKKKGGSAWFDDCLWPQSERHKCLQFGIRHGITYCGPRTNRRRTILVVTWKSTEMNLVQRGSSDEISVCVELKSWFSFRLCQKDDGWNYWRFFKVELDFFSGLISTV